MEQTLNPDIATLQRMTTSELRQRYAEVFGDQPATWNRVWMLKRIAWRLQALAEGGLSERAQRRAEEVANDADLRLNAPKLKTADAPAERAMVQSMPAPIDNRLPPPGTILTRLYKGQTVCAPRAGPVYPTATTMVGSPAATWIAPPCAA